MARQQSDLAGNNAEFRPTRSGGLPRRQRSQNHFVQRALEVEIHLLTGLILKDEKHRILMLIKPSLDMREHLLEVPRSDQPVAGECSIGFLFFHRPILPR